MGVSVTMTENAVSKGLHEIGVMVEDSRFLKHRIFDMIPDDLKTNLSHPFYDFSRSARILARQERVHVNEASKMIARNPELLFEIHDLKPGEAPIKTVPAKKAQPKEPKPTIIVEKSLPSGPKFRKGFNIEDLSASIRATFEETQKRPASNDGVINHGPLAGKFSWASVNQKLIGAKKSYPDFAYGSLKEIVISVLGQKEKAVLPVKEKPAMAVKKKSPRVMSALPVDDILESARLTLAANETRLSGNVEIKHGPMAGKRWASIDVAIRKRAASDENLGFKSLSALLKLNGISGRQVSLSARAVFNLLSAQIGKTGEIPLTAEIEKLGPFSAGKINKAFARACLPGLDSYTLPGQTPPRSLQEFMLVSGLAKIEDRKLVPALPLSLRQPV